MKTLDDLAKTCAHTRYWFRVAWRCKKCGKQVVSNGNHPNVECWYCGIIFRDVDSENLEYVR